MGRCVNLWDNFDSVFISNSDQILNIVQGVDLGAAKTAILG
jgi:hypothetical protein